MRLVKKLFIASIALLASSSLVKADTFVGVSGTSYTKAADGHYYPSQYVLPNGQVRPPVQTVTQPTPHIFYLYQQYNCPNGQCPNQRPFK